MNVPSDKNFRKNIPGHRTKIKKTSDIFCEKEGTSLRLENEGGLPTEVTVGGLRR